MPNIKQIYVGTNLVRPYKKIECDFTQSDCGFSIAESHSTDYGRNSSGFYVKSRQTWGAGARLPIPSSITSQGTPTKIELYVGGGNNGSGVGISEGIDTRAIRIFNNELVVSSDWGTGSQQTVSETPTSSDVLVIDFQNSVTYMQSSPNTKLTVNTTPLTLWNNNTLNLCILSPNKNYYAYLSKAIFYVS